MTTINEFMSDFDRLFIRLASEYWAAIQTEYRNDYEQCLDPAEIDNNVQNDLSHRHRKLFTDSEMSDIKNHFKLAITQRAIGILKQRRIDPIAYFITAELPSIRAEHIEYMKCSEFSYSFDSGFINEHENSVVELLAQNWVYEHFDYHLKDVNASFTILSSSIDGLPKKKISVSSMTDLYTGNQNFTRLFWAYFNGEMSRCSHDTFKTHFASLANKTPELPFDSERLLVYTFYLLEAQTQISKQDTWNFIQLHFVKKDGSEFETGQLRSVYTQVKQKAPLSAKLAEAFVRDLID